MSEAPKVQESALHPDDLFTAAALEVHCPVCQKYTLRSIRVDLKRVGYSAYRYTCSDPTCEGAVTLMVPRTSAAKRSVGPTLAAKETELEPDDTFSVAQLDVLCQTGDEPCVREDKEPDGERTAYLYACPDCGSRTTILVPRGLFGDGL